MSTVDPYGVLGVKRDASHRKIEGAYRRLATKPYADLHPGNPHAERRFQEVTAAYDLRCSDRLLDQVLWRALRDLLSAMHARSPAQRRLAELLQQETSSCRSAARMAQPLPRSDPGGSGLPE